MSKNLEFFRRFVLGRRYEIFSLVAASIVLWQLLLPGYVLTLDLVFGPIPKSISWIGTSAAGAPLRTLFEAAYLLMPGWMVQKILLITTITALFYLPLRYYPFSRVRGLEFFVAMVFAVNPFVYERLLAGQWGIVMAYALLFPVIALCIEFLLDRELTKLLMAGMFLVLLAIFSLHIFAIGIFCTSIMLLAGAIHIGITGSGSHLRSFVVHVAILVGLVTLLCLYWLVPVFILPQGTQLLQSFDASHWQTFKTAGDPHWGVLANVVGLYGFWGEHEEWARAFTFPKSSPTSLLALLGLGAVGLYGMSSSLCLRQQRGIYFGITIIGLSSMLFSIGIASAYSAPVAYWMYGHVPFWVGFRDASKWNAALSLVYALSAGLGLHEILQLKYLRNTRSAAVAAVVVLSTLPVLYTPSLFLGFSGQLHPTWYPEAWATVDTMLSTESACKAVFLPWHQYYSASFAHDVLIANPAAGYFHCSVATSLNAEIGEVTTGALKGADYDDIARAVEDNTGDIDGAALKLRDLGIRFIIVSRDVVTEDEFSYGFLLSKHARKIFDGPAIALYELM